jgi:hypothetical protein
MAATTSAGSAARSRWASKATFTIDATRAAGTPWPDTSATSRPTRASAATKSQKSPATAVRHRPALTRSESPLIPSFVRRLSPTWNGGRASRS